MNVHNLACSCVSSRDYLSTNEYDLMCENIGEGDYLFIQFGRFDLTSYDPVYRYLPTYPNLDTSTLDENGMDDEGRYSYEWVILNKYVNVARSKGATPVLVTPPAHRNDNGTPNIEEYIPYRDALIQLGEEYNIPVVDLTTLTYELYTEYYEKGGAAETAKLNAHADSMHRTMDNKAFSYEGAKIVGKLIANEVKELRLKLGARVK